MSGWGREHTCWQEFSTEELQPGVVRERCSCGKPRTVIVVERPATDRRAEPRAEDPSGDTTLELS